MVEATYKIEGMTCGSCAMKIEKGVQTLNGVQKAHVDFRTRMLTITAPSEIDRQRVADVLDGLGPYALKDAQDAPPPIHSVLAWGLGGAVIITLVFYLVQVFGMRDWMAPVEFMTDQWYLVTPLVLGFGTQAGLFRAIHLLSHHGGGVVMTGSGSVSGGTMLACCMHNLVPLFPVLGISGLATFFASYRTQVFLASIGVTLLGVGYMSRKYYSIKRAHERSGSEKPS